MNAEENHGFSDSENEGESCALQPLNQEEEDIIKDLVNFQ